MKRSGHLIGFVLAVAACKGKKADPTPLIQTAPIARQDIVVDVEATGVIQPINAVQVKSKASGQVMHLHVSTGSQVKPKDLLVEIDPRDAKSRHDQAVAALQAAQANVTVTKAQLARSQSLATEGVITAPEVETAILASAKATSDLVAAQAALDQAKIALEDVTIRAPMAGTVIEKRCVGRTGHQLGDQHRGGGTTLLTMADLGQVYDSTLVSESDIGNVKAGQTASVKVDAYPNRTFTGTVEKIAPQATVQQSVTMFPVLIRLDNRNGALMPGMNTDVSILVEHADNVLAIPNDAVRSPRDAATAATALGLDPAKVRESLASQRGGGAGGGRASAAGGAPAVTVSQSQCDSVQNVLASHPASQSSLSKLRQQMRTDTAHAAQLRASMKATTDSLHLDPGVLRGCMQLRRSSAGGAALAMGDGSETPTPGNTRPHAGLVFVAANGTFEPRMAMLGVGNYDVTQVLSGLNEGDNVALINAAMLQQQRVKQQQRIQSRMGLPGVNQGSGAAAGGGRAGGAAGGARGAGGGASGGAAAGGAAAGGAAAGGAAAGGARPAPPAGPPPP